MVLDFDHRPNATTDEKVQSLMENVQLALNEHESNMTGMKETLQGISSFPKILWRGVVWPLDTQVISTAGTGAYKLNGRLDEVRTGVILAWSAYANGAPQDFNWDYQFIPKEHITAHGTTGVGHFMATEGLGTIGCKYVYVSATEVKGNAKNDDTGTSNGITYKNNYWVLRYIIGV